ncbi:MAG: choice-of-anchor D domain-containing protein [Candidatus Eisenbacteria sp.]|nr:choice-of-anchor D domain-containing protein [Candidatus Eisenbacteria bacterium]
MSTRMPTLIIAAALLATGIIPNPAAAEVILKSFEAPYGYRSYGLTWDGQYLWCGDDYHGAIAKIDTSDGHIITEIPGAYESNHGLAWDGTHLWVAGDYHTDYIYKITTAGARVDSILNPGGDYSGGMTYDGRNLWVTRYYPNTQPNLFSVEPTSGAIQDTIPSQGLQPQGMAWDGEYLWNVMDDNDGDEERVWQIHPLTGDTLMSFPVPYTGTASGESPRGLAWDGQYLWLVSRYPGSPTMNHIYKIDPFGGGTPQISLSHSDYDYGHTIIGDPGVFLLGISNLGTGNLVVDSVCCADPAFSFPGVFPQTVEPDSTFYLPVTFSPAMWGPAGTTLTVYSNDPVGAPPQVALAGWGVWPDQEIGISENSHDYGLIRVNADKRWLLRVQNEGAQPLILYSATTSRSIFSVRNTQFPVQIDSTEAFDLDVWFNPPSHSTYGDTLEIACNDADEPILRVPLAGTGDGSGHGPGALLWSYQVTGSYSDKVTSIRALRDVNGDGFEDVIACAENYRTYCFNGNGSGVADTLWSFDTSIDPYRTGSVYQDRGMTPVEDLDGDGIQDVVIGTAGGSRSVFAISGADGSQIWSYDSHEYGDGGWIYEVAPIEDVDGDGVEDVLAAAGDDGSLTGPRRAYCLSGATGAKIWARFLSASVFCVRAIDDVNGDGKDEVAAATTDGILYILDAAAGTVLDQYDAGSTIWTVAAIEDITGDGKKDIVLGTSNGLVHAVDSSDGTTAWPGTVNVGSIITDISVIRDQNGDSVGEITVAGVMYDYFVIDGAAGSILWSRPSDHKAFATSGVPDLSGNGLEDVIGGSGYNVNRVTIMEGSSGDTVWTRYTAGPVETVSPFKNIDWDPSAEVLVGTRAGEILCLAGGGAVTDVVASEDIDRARSIRMRIYPNPFNPVTTIAFNVPLEGKTTLAIFDVRGRCVKTLIDGAITAGEHSAVWDGRNRSGVASAPGVYFARLESASEVLTRKMILAK